MELKLIYGIVFSVVSVVGCLMTVNSVFPMRGSLVVEIGGVLGGFCGELAAQQLLVQVALWVLIGKMTPALDSRIGKVGAFVSLVNVVILSFLSVQFLRTRKIVRKALDDYGVNGNTSSNLFTFSGFYDSIARPFYVKNPKVKRVKNISYYEDGRYGKFGMLDWYHNVNPNPKSPVLIAIHGGGWVAGAKEHRSGVALLGHMAANGWSCFSINYRLAPSAKFPSQIIDVKKAIAFVRENADKYFADGDFICITGGSAGGHLCALAAVTANDPSYQPGFEYNDTSVAAAVPFYGVYRLGLDDDDDGNVNNNNNNLNATMTSYIYKILIQSLSNKAHFADQSRRYAKFWDRMILSKTDRIDNQRKSKAMPYHHVKNNGNTSIFPPFFIIHGANDTLVSVLQGRTLKKELESRNVKVAFAEIPITSHSFNAFQTMKTKIVHDGVREWLEQIHSQYKQNQDQNQAHLLLKSSL